MANLYADENFRFSVVQELRRLGHDVLTAQEAGQASRKVSDEAVLAYASGLQRAVLTFNRRHFIKLHRRMPNHRGIIACTYDDDWLALAQRIHQAILAHDPLGDKLLRINKPAKV